MAVDDLQIRVISLEGQTVRRQRMTDFFDGASVDWAFSKAVAGTEFSDFPVEYQHQKRRRDVGYDMTKNEIACFLSHRKVWRECAGGRSAFLVMEDDACILSGGLDLGGLIELTNKLVEKSSEKTIFRLGHGCEKKYFLRVCGVSDFEVVRYFSDPQCAFAYIVTPSIARLLEEKSRSFFCPIDNFLWKTWVHGCVVFDLSPCAVLVAPESENPSTIGHRGKPKLNFIGKLNRELFRMFSRVVNDVANLYVFFVTYVYFRFILSAGHDV